MSAYKLSLRYAKSLLDLAIESNKLAEIYEDVKLIDQTISSSADLKAMLKSPVITSDRKLNVLAALFKDKTTLVTWSYIELVVKKGREAFLVDFGNCFEELYNKMNQISKIKVTTAIALAEEVQREIINNVPTKDKLIIENVIDSEILGGFKLQFGDNLYDASINKKLRDIKAIFSDESFVDKV